jgi:oligopeptide transport system ATP-binding protein
VMYLGKVVETGTHTDVYEEPAHPYSRALLSAEPGLAQHRGRRSRIVLAGDPPSPIDPPPGCRFHPRCWMREDACTSLEPALTATGSSGHLAACHFAGDTDRDPA